MNLIDYLVLFGVIAAIVVYGILRTRGRRTLHDYLRGKKQGGGSWFTIGLSVMATQASAITFLSTPGQGYADGMKFIQNYFAIPLALIIIAAFFLPIYRKLNVYTAYEYLDKRFDKKTRLLAAAIFLLNRAIGAGYTIYAPAIVLSTVFGWSLTATIIASSCVVTLYTLIGGSDAVTQTQKYQLAVIFGGMITAFVILLSKIPCSFTDALTLAGHFGKTNAVNFSPNLKDRYTFWSGMLGGIFLMLSYFGTDQSQVQHYISGDNLRESRLGLMFNALFKIPMQFGILLLGVMLFVFYVFNPAPPSFNRTVYDQLRGSKATVTVGNSVLEGNGAIAPADERLAQIEKELRSDADAEREFAGIWLQDRRKSDNNQDVSLVGGMVVVDHEARALREEVNRIMHSVDPRVSLNDSDYVFITFILDNLPHGLIGLLVACFFAAALNSKAAELNALATCTTVDIYRYLLRPAKHKEQAEPRPSGSDLQASDATRSLPDGRGSDDKHYVRASKLFTAFWGLMALLFALFCNLSENLIQATNIVSSLFYPVLLSIFLCGFFIKFLSATPVFIGALSAQALVLFLYFYVPDSTLSYLWYNPIGCLACIVVAITLQPLIGKPRGEAPEFPVLASDAPTA